MGSNEISMGPLSNMGSNEISMGPLSNMGSNEISNIWDPMKYPWGPSLIYEIQ